MKKKYGFTLAEVLITLGIIGVVAALTIPTLIGNYQKTQYVTQLKKAYTQFNQALQLMITDHGCTNDLKCTEASVGSPEALGAEMVKYFKVVKDCGATPNQGCMPKDASYSFDGSTSRMSVDESVSWYRFITEDGTAFAITGASSNCEDAGLSTHMTNNLAEFCGYLDIDVNGPSKGPNNYGRDIFEFVISNGKGTIIYPSGGIDDASVPHWIDTDGNIAGCDSNVDVYGIPCAGRVIEEGWQMNY